MKRPVSSHSETDFAKVVGKFQQLKRTISSHSGKMQFFQRQVVSHQEFMETIAPREIFLSLGISVFHKVERCDIRRL